VTQTIAFAGKGGTGKTTICGVLVDYLAKNHKGPILAVDADANSNLNEVLGVEVEKTLGEIREIVAHAELAETSPIPSGVSKQDWAQYQFNSALLELDDYDLLVMGRTQGQGCYCYVNGLLKTQITQYAKNYRYVIVDNEAGLEHISRGVLPKVDILLLVSDCSRRGIQAAGRLKVMVDELGLKPSMVKLIVNRAPSGDAAALEAGILEEIALQKLDLIGVVPTDESVYRADAEGCPTVELPADTPMKQAVQALIDTLDL
jgi:CO dehydrogenase maturation factor